MDEIKVGEYVRLARCQGINKIIDIDEDGFLILDDIIADEYGDECCQISLQDADKEILKHNFNIIDLIEVGDFVNGQRVLCLKKNNDDCRDDIGTSCIGIGDINIYIGYNEANIKTILTHEQYERNCYRLGVG